MLGDQFWIKIESVMNWLENSAKLEKSILEACAGQVRQVVDDLLPQIRLAASENEGAAIVEIKMGFEFEGEPDKTRIVTEGAVAFPAKRAYAEAVCR
tara:strand:+ start:2692 stop:2982 length:291 start_codon:yes stop_codon:yes gene_type:complete